MLHQRKVSNKKIVYTCRFHEAVECSLRTINPCALMHCYLERSHGVIIDCCSRHAWRCFINVLCMWFVFRFSSKVMPLCLPRVGETYEDLQDCSIVGWGPTSLLGEVSLLHICASDEQITELVSLIWLFFYAELTQSCRIRNILMWVKSSSDQALTVRWPMSKAPIISRRPSCVPEVPWVPSTPASVTPAAPCPAGEQGRPRSHCTASSPLATAASRSWLQTPSLASPST